MTKQEAADHLSKVTTKYNNTYEPKSIFTYQYWAMVKKIVDADTIDLQFSLGFDTTAEKRTRLIGVNTPEIYSVPHSSLEYKKGQLAVDFVNDWVSENDWVEVKIFHGVREKYGRWLGEIYKNGESLNVALLASGHALPIQG